MKVILSDGTVFEGTQNGNTFVSPVELTMDDFTGKLSKITIVWDDSGEQVMEEAEVIQIVKYDNIDGWYVSIYEPTEEEKERKRLRKELEEKEREITELQIALADVYEMVV